MGISQRQKGSRMELKLRDFLRARGWKADRVPMSGAAYMMKGDVTAEKDGRKVLFELKSRRDEFKRIYALYDYHLKHAQDDVLSFVAAGENRLCVSVSTSLEAVLEPIGLYEFCDRLKYPKEFDRTFKKIAGLQKVLQTCDILVLQDDRKPFLFIRYI